MTRAQCKPGPTRQTDSYTKHFLLVFCVFPSEQILNEQLQSCVKKNKGLDLSFTHKMFILFINPSPRHAKA